MKKTLPWIALAALVLPILARTLWFYRGIPARPAIATPDYAALEVPAPPIETAPAADDEPEQYGGIVVVDQTHSNQVRPAEIQSLKEAVEQRGAKLEFLDDSSQLETSLKYASAYLVFSPALAFNASEIDLIHAFTARGGRLAVFTDATRGQVYTDYYTGSSSVIPDANAVNPLLAGYGISVNDDYLYDLEWYEGNFRNVFFEEFGKSELTFGLKRITLYGAHSIEAEAGSILLKTSESTLSSITDSHDAARGGAALADDGNAIVFGDFTFLTHPYRSVTDNAILIENLSEFLLGGERQASLETFPFLFEESKVVLYPTADVQLTAELVSSLGRLQAGLRRADLTLELTSEPPSEGDAILLGTFSENQDLDPYYLKFDLELDEGFLTLPGLGQVGRAGNGLLLYDAEEGARTLVLLAETPEDLITLVDLLSEESLSACVIQSPVGLCSVGVGESFSDGESFDLEFLDGELFNEEFLFPEEEVPTPEPTPAG